MSMDETGRVLYLGSFSKVMFKSLRLGYLVVPPELSERFQSLHAELGPQASSVAQPAMAEFITSGQFAAHIRRMRRLYAKRRAFLLDRLVENCSGLITPQPANSGNTLQPVPAAGHTGTNAIPQRLTLPQPGPSAGNGFQQPLPSLQSLAAAGTSIDPTSRHPNAVRIPLTVPDGEPLMFGRNDVLLEDGDIILVESREQDHFFTGGLLGGGQYALPRNQDLDVLDAVLLADSYARSTQLNSPTRAIGGVSVLNRDVTRPVGP